MGNNRFKLSELIPNAWFHKLRDMGKLRRKQQQSQQNITLSPSPFNKHHTLPPTTTAPSPRRSCKTAPSDTPRKSALRRRPALSSSTPSAAACFRTKPQLDFSTTSCDSTATTGTGSFSPEFRSDQVLITKESLESSWRPAFKPPTQELELRPIITKPANKATIVRKTALSSPAGVRLRMRSPRISTRKLQNGGGRRNGWSRAVVKASVDPRKDFKESMEEMIAENKIRASKDLEELLACYLCLNADEYHHIIINVFKQIWLDLNHNSS